MLGARNSSWFIKDPQSLLHSVKKTVLKSNFHYVYQDVFCLIFVTKIGASNSLIYQRKNFKYLIKCCYRKRKLRKQNLGGLDYHLRSSVQSHRLDQGERDKCKLH